MLPLLQYPTHGANVDVLGDRLPQAFMWTATSSVSRRMFHTDLGPVSVNASAYGRPTFTVSIEVMPNYSTAQTHMVILQVSTHLDLPSHN
ncbi:hypothetical protein BVRB_4g084480 [Beta vulgaris subsp. vulgaris]|uniref:Uncharacterized protein n=1 Tax=Beta vulgaris subsp. vulgaris TaxID=3555 RepID=A0A0J8CIG6_BETVV|nr:hypothetical protein BVRB_4g084480 [Beta vulgaris subsp. vulgaris]